MLNDKKIRLIGLANRAGKVRAGTFVTEKLVSALEGIGIRVIDHIIAAGASRYLSMNDSGQMDQYYNF